MREVDQCWKESGRKPRSKKSEPGTLRFDLYRDPKDENAFYVYEAYRDQKAFEEHKKNEPYQHWESHIRPEMVIRFEPFFEKVEAVHSSAT
jgi:quinol monooxygenase YgiN